MFELVKTFDILGSINAFLKERRQSLGISDVVTLRPRLINQEKGGLIIYTWNDVSEDPKVLGPVTHVGVYDPILQQHKVQWIYNQKVKIVSCSVNKERTLLGFTTVSRQEAGADGKHKDLYQAFLAELQSRDPRVFSLNLQRSSFLKVQFLAPETSPSSGSLTSSLTSSLSGSLTSSTSSSVSGSPRHSYMLVMLHKESIGLYQIHVARIGDHGIMMSGQPTTEQLVKKFVWCQFDVTTQRLCYIQSQRHAGMTGHDSVGHKMCIIQFHSAATCKYDSMIDIPINFPFPDIRTASRSYYLDIPLYNGIPDATLNVAVLSQNNGSLCVCYQEFVSPTAAPRKTAHTTAAQDEESDDKTVNVNYYVCMVHHAKTLHGCATGLPRSLVATKRITFHWFGEYLLAVIPGVFCHLLNVSVDFEPCHHILLHNHEIPTASRPPVPSSIHSGNSVDVLEVASGHLSPDSDSKFTTSTDLTESVSDSSVMSPSMLPSPGLDLFKAWSENSASDLSQGNVASPAPPQLQPQVSRSLSRPESELPAVLCVVSGTCVGLGSVLVPCFGFSREAGAAGCNLYDGRSGQVWRIASNPEGLLRCFREAYWSTKLAILHYLLLMRTRDIATIKQVFEVITEDPTVPETTTFLSEFLVASTFASMRKKTDKEMSQLLTFTASDTFRGQFEKSSTGERLARVMYISLDSVNISTKSSQERRRRSSEDGWDLLRRSLRSKQMPPPSRFSHEHVQKALRKEIDVQGLASPRRWMWIGHQLDESFFDGMHIVKLTDIATLRPREGYLLDAVGGRRSRTESVLRPAPLFLQASSVSKSQPQGKMAAITEQLLVSHMMHHLKKDTRIKAQNIAREYINCQLQQCHQLCHLLWSIHTDLDTCDYERLLPKLNEVGTDMEYKLFQIYERFFLVSHELAFPKPAGFSSYFTSLGFKCLTQSLFLQYVDRGILHLTPDFILQLLEDLDDSADEANVEIKFNIISRLPKPFAEDCLHRWNHSIAQHLSARQQVANVLQEGMSCLHLLTEGNLGDRGVIITVQGGDDAQSISSMDATFKPLAVFMKHLEDIAIEVQRQKPNSSQLLFDPGAIEDAALSYTKQSLHVDLSATNF